MNRPLRVAVLPVLAVLTACAAPRSDAPQPSALQWPEFAPARENERVYRVDERRSLLLARVDPAGPMADLGHSHIVGGPVISGRVVAQPEGAGRFDLRVKVDELSVDRPSWRRAHGLEPELDPSAVEGTRSNLQSDRVLDAQNHPFIEIRSVAARGPAWLPEVTLRVRLRGRVAEYTVPVSVERSDRHLRATAAFDLRHSDFGLAPFSTAGGALRVSDRIRVRVRIVAVAAGADVAIIAGSPGPPETS